jgi:hypothetical protein
LEHQIDLRFPLLDLLANAIHISELSNIRFEEFDSAFLIQDFAFLNNPFCRCFISSDKVDSRRYSILHESFESELSDTTGAAHCNQLEIGFPEVEQSVSYQKELQAQGQALGAGHWMHGQHQEIPWWIGYCMNLGGWLNIFDYLMIPRDWNS